MYYKMDHSVFKADMPQDEWLINVDIMMYVQPHGIRKY